MKEIKGMFNISNSDPRVFYNDTLDAINKLQADGQEVEVQYTTNITANGVTLVYNALVIGRK
jgi:hypothetical protein